MTPKEVVITVATVVVGGIIVAGATIGWESLIGSVRDWMGSPRISVTPMSNPHTKVPITGEQVWLNLENIETDRVYWLFDEGERFVVGGVQIQYAFPYQETAPEGAEVFRRIDAFYKDGDDYFSTRTRQIARNIKQQPQVSIQKGSLEVLSSPQLLGRWKLNDIKLARYSAGLFEEESGYPTLGSIGLSDNSVSFSFQHIAKLLGYKPGEDVATKLSEDHSAWILSEYVSGQDATKLTLAQPITELKDQALKPPEGSPQENRAEEKKPESLAPMEPDA